MVSARSTHSSTSQGPLVIAIERAAPEEGSSIGGKAASLAELARAGFPVPATFVVTVAGYRAHMLGVADKLQAVRAQLAAGELPDDAELEALRSAVERAELPRELADSLRQHYADKLSGRLVAVRSSGTSEDLADASFAGQYETYLNVDAEGLEVAVKRCFASAWQPRVLRYARERGLELDSIEMAVAVQQMVPAEVSGVLFTVNPLNGRERESVVEAVWGLGEPLVSGLVEADRFVVDPQTQEVRERHLSEQSFKLVGDSEGNRRVELDADQGYCLDDERLAEVVELGAAIQEHYGRPMDVEWAVCEGKVHALQARPITQITFTPQAGEWTTADFRDGGVSSAVCSPLMWSLYRLAVEDSMPRYFRDLKLISKNYEGGWYDVFFARPYWGMGEVKRALECIPGYDEDGFHADMGIPPDPENPGKKTPMTLRGILRALPVLFALKKSYREVLQHNERFAQSFDERKTPFDLAPSSLVELEDAEFHQLYARLIGDFYLESEASYFTTIYNTGNAKIDLKPVLDKVSSKLDKPADELVLVAGLSDLSHMRPLREMHQLAGRFSESGQELDEATVREFAERWSHHSRRELDIRVPRWVDDLDYVRQMLQGAIDNFRPVMDPDLLEASQRERYLAERERIAAGLGPMLRRKFERQLDLVRTYAWWREEMRDYSTKTYELVRRWSVEAGRRLLASGSLRSEEDIWYLEWRQIVDALSGALDAGEVAELVKMQRRTVRSFRNFENPNEIGVGYGQTASTAVSADGSLAGTGCSAGCITARARVVHSLEEAQDIRDGEILVTHFTDPGWTPLFARLAGVVTETGGILSHAAVISREYGFPAVLAVKDATKQIPDGATITVDGSRGVIAIEEKEPQC
jgi:pyruvate,water dikinase